VFVVCRFPGRARARAWSKLLHRHGLDAIDLTDNEMASCMSATWSRARARGVNEVLYRFEFPERPGALMQFCKA